MVTFYEFWQDDDEKLTHTHLQLRKEHKWPLQKQNIDLRRLKKINNKQIVFKKNYQLILGIPFEVSGTEFDIISIKSINDNNVVICKPIL
jgi:hypothetical protein